MLGQMPAGATDQRQGFVDAGALLFQRLRLKVEAGREVGLTCGKHFADAGDRQAETPQQ